MTCGWRNHSLSIPKPTSYSICRQADPSFVGGLSTGGWFSSLEHPYFEFNTVFTTVLTRVGPRGHRSSTLKSLFRTKFLLQYCPSKHRGIRCFSFHSTAKDSALKESLVSVCGSFHISSTWPSQMSEIVAALHATGLTLQPTTTFGWCASGTRLPFPICMLTGGLHVVLSSTRCPSCLRNRLPTRSLSFILAENVYDFLGRSRALRWTMYPCAGSFRWGTWMDIDQRLPVLYLQSHDRHTWLVLY